MFCRFFKFRISSAVDSHKPLGPLTDRHLAGCPACRQFRRACEVLGRDLRSEAASLAPASRQFARQILADVSVAPQRQRRIPLWAPIAAAAAILLAMIPLFPDRQTLPASAPASSAYSISTPRVELPKAWAHAAETPLAAEIQNLSSNAQSGIRFLVACLPIRPIEGIPTPQSEPTAVVPIQ